ATPNIPRPGPATSPAPRAGCRRSRSERMRRGRELGCRRSHERKQLGATRTAESEGRATESDGGEERSLRGSDGDRERREAVLEPVDELRPAASADALELPPKRLRVGHGRAREGRERMVREPRFEVGRRQL